MYQKLTPEQKNRGAQLARGFVAKEEPRNPALEPPLPSNVARCANSRTDRSAEFQQVSNLLVRADACSRGTNGQRNLPEAIRLWTEAAKAGSRLAQYNLGSIYYHGAAGETNCAKAASWFRKAAEGGWGRAQVGLGFLLEEGLGVESNAVEALYWYRKAAKQGDPVAAYLLATSLREDGGTNDLPEVVQWLRKAADAGEGAAETDLGLLYLDGTGVPKDFDLAFKLSSKAAAKGIREAQYNLALCYRTGKGTPENPAGAVSWYRRSAEQGHANAMAALSVCYLKGIGVEPDPVEAWRWWTLANQRSDDLSIRIRDALKSEEFQELTPDQKNRGAQLAQNFVAKAQPPILELALPLPWDVAR